MPINPHNQPKEHPAALAFAAIGVVFGDIGTSPLYAVKEIFHGGLPLDKAHVLGVLSLIFWALILVVTAKYTIFIMRADNKGEGGIMALLALALQGSADNPGRKRRIVTLGLLGAALFYGDGIITPAISVLGAVEGLSVVAPRMEHYVLPAALAVLSLLFILQARGDSAIGRWFAPLMSLWFVALAVMGLNGIIREPGVLMAVNPYYAVHLLFELGWRGFLIMGALVLVITGVEALYADMGRFGLKPIRYAWFGLVFPALLLNYFGQGALLLEHPGAIRNPFYLLAPAWASYPLLILATLAAVIASQAVISGAFTITRQAIQLGYCPRMDILHIPGSDRGEVFMPTVNWLLMAAVFLLVLSFQSVSALASAYGIAVTGTMIVDTVLAFTVFQALRQWKKYTSMAFLSVFLAVDFVFLASNSLKITTGGWLPIIVGTLLFLAMTTWIKGRALMTEYLDQKRVLFEDLEDRMRENPPAIVKGSAIYLARSVHGVPQVFLHNYEHNHVLHEQLIVLTIVTKDEPYVDEAHRVKIRAYLPNRNLYRVKFYFGFQQPQDVRRALELCAQHGLEIDPKQVSFFIGNERISFRRKSPMPPWRRSLFQFLFHNASSAIEFFKIPVDRVIELGIRIEL